MPTSTLRAPRRPPRRRARGFRSLIVALLVVLGSRAIASDLATTPYRAVVDGLLERFHAESRPCALALGESDACFVVRPARVALLAATLEVYVVEHGGSLYLGAWTSANGAHRVVLTLADEAWGSLELWLAERPDHVVEGWFERDPRLRE
jgi:hypothetical protein